MGQADWVDYSPARLSSGWVTTGTTDLSKTSRTRWYPGWRLPPDSWNTPLLQTLSSSHSLLLQDYGCVEWTSASDRVSAPLVVTIVLPFVQRSVDSRNSPPPLSTVTVPQEIMYQCFHIWKTETDCRVFQWINDQIREDFVCGMFQTMKRKIELPKITRSLWKFDQYLRPLMENLWLCDNFGIGSLQEMTHSDCLPVSVLTVRPTIGNDGA